MKKGHWIIIAGLLSLGLMIALVPAVLAQGPFTNNGWGDSPLTDTPAAGQTQGWGQGGMMRGADALGAGRGQGRMMNGGSGVMGRGQGFVDENGDGICDHAGTGQGRGQGFVDENGDGICDHAGTGRGQGQGFVDEDGDGICDHAGTGQGRGRGRMMGRWTQ